MSEHPHIQAFAQQYEAMFQLEECVSNADSAVIFRARDRLRDIPVCLKFYDDFPDDGQRRDWRINATIKSEFLATNFLVLVFTYEGRHRAVACLEWIEGPTFEQFTVAVSRLAPEDGYLLLPKLIREVVAPLAKNVHSLHVRRIGHGDLHGLNIKVKILGHEGSRRFEAVLYDFFAGGPGEQPTEDELIEADVRWLKERMHDVLSRVSGGSDLLRVVAQAVSAGGIAFALQTFVLVVFESDRGIFRRSRPLWARQLIACGEYARWEPAMSGVLVELLRTVAENAGESEVFRDAERLIADPNYDYRDDNAGQLPIADVEAELGAQRQEIERTRGAVERLIRNLPDR